MYTLKHITLKHVICWLANMPHHTFKREHKRLKISQGSLTRKTKANPLSQTLSLNAKQDTQEFM